MLRDVLQVEVQIDSDRLRTDRSGLGCLVFRVGLSEVLLGLAPSEFEYLRIVVEN